MVQWNMVKRYAYPTLSKWWFLEEAFALYLGYELEISDVRIFGIYSTLYADIIKSKESGI